MNKIHIIGNLTRDPVLKKVQTANGEVSCCTFAVAVNDRRDRDKTDYFNVTVWRGLADNCAKYLSKGRKVAVVGSISLHTYNAADGTTRASMEVQGEDVEFLSSSQTTQQETTQQPTAPKYQQIQTEDVPW